MAMWSFIESRGVDLGDALSARDGGKAALQGEIARHGLDPGKLSIAVSDGVVRLTGRARDRATREKIILALGNVRGVSAVRDDVPHLVDPHFYTVVPGDTLHEIARITLGDASRHREVFEANQPMLPAPEALYYGLVLRIPRV